MGRKRSISQDIIHSDLFNDLSQGAKLIYLIFNIEADDDGFIGEPRTLASKHKCTLYDLKQLAECGFIKFFKDGVIVIRHWHINCNVRADRKIPTVYQSHLSTLTVKDNVYISNNDNDFIDVEYMEMSNNILQIESDKQMSTKSEKYKDGSLPYSFERRIKPLFYNKLCPLCNNIMTETGDCRPSVNQNIPTKLGGKREIANISIICTKCNNSSFNRKAHEPLNTNEVIEQWDSINSKKYTKNALDNVIESQCYSNESHFIESHGCQNESHNFDESFIDYDSIESHGCQNESHVQVNYMAHGCQNEVNTSYQPTKTQQMNLADYTDFTGQNAHNNAMLTSISNIKANNIGCQVRLTENKYESNMSPKNQNVSHTNSKVSLTNESHLHKMSLTSNSQIAENQGNLTSQNENWLPQYSLGKDRLGYYFLEKESDTQINNPNQPKKPYGELSNVYLTEDEYKQLLNESVAYENLIDRLSLYIVNHPKYASIPSHFYKLKEWFLQEKSRYAQKQQKNKWDCDMSSYDNFDFSEFEKDILSN